MRYSGLRIGASNSADVFPACSGIRTAASHSADVPSESLAIEPPTTSSTLVCKMAATTNDSEAAVSDSGSQFCARCSADAASEFLAGEPPTPMSASPTLHSRILPSLPLALDVLVQGQ